jgi:hypothetical protein
MFRSERILRERELDDLAMRERSSCKAGLKKFKRRNISYCHVAIVISRECN